MKHTRSTIYVVLLAILSLTATAQVGCFGKTARQRAAVPALVLASEGVQSDVIAGIHTLEPQLQDAAINTQAAFFGAVRTKDRLVISAEAMHLWPQVKVMAENGITAKQSAGLIGPAGANAFRERLARFEETLSLASMNLN